jgi:hypothetical protein
MDCIRELMAQTDQNDEEYKRLSEAAEKVGEAVKVPATF